MSHHHAETVPRAPLLGIGVLVAAALLSVATVRLSGTPIRQPDAAAVATRHFAFEDRHDGSVAVVDVEQHRVVEIVRGEAGFLRGALRALARERAKRGVGPDAPFDLIARADGRLTLSDPSTGERLDLESFGPTNAAVFGRLLGAGR
ncbi:MAG: photosynthetic complex assembly protein PuhC [Rubrivivax sp.]